MKDNKDSIDSKTNNKLILDQYYQPIFPPHYLYVAKNYTNKDIEDLFVWEDGEEINLDKIERNVGLTYCFVYRKDDPDKNFSILILLDAKNIDKHTEYASVCSHEASHAAHHMLDYCSIKLDDSTTEVYAFVIGWITECCVKTFKKKHE